MKTCGKLNENPFCFFFWFFFINNSSLKRGPKGGVIVIPPWVNELISEACCWGTAWYRLLLSACTGGKGPRAKKGNEDTVPSVLYVACLELYSTGAGRKPSVGEPCNILGLQRRDAQYEAHKVKHTNHISCALFLKKKKKIGRGYLLLIALGMNMCMYNEKTTWIFIYLFFFHNLRRWLIIMLRIS